MKKFIFPLESVLRLKKNEEEKALLALSRLQEKKNHCEKMISDAAKRETAALKKWPFHSLEGLKYRSRYQILQEEKRKKYTEQIVSGKKELDEARKDYEETRRASETLTHYREKKFKDYLLQLKKKEIQQLDEFVSMKYSGGNK